ncbi:MAG: hypothetical protein HY238_28550, partial [Acidobacteria bacterium]|nr:hypothetical protein [Acidobacteriota bacterium]
ISRENHCGAHEGPDLGAFRTDPRGTIEFLAPLVKLYLDAPHYQREKEYWAVNGLTVGPEPDVVVQKAWDLPKRHYELRVRAADGSPAAGVVISQTLRTRECGVSTGAVGQTDAAGVARIEIAAAATERLELAAANRPPRPLSGAELHALFSQGRITLPAEAETWPIRHNHDHVQGLDVSDRWFWISAVDRRTKTGWVWRVDRQTLRTVAERNITHGALYHPGGLQVSGSSLWIPIAEYRPNSSSRILELDAMTLAERRSFVVPDHIGAVATDGKTFVLGANWDARKLYRWNLDGKLLESRDNPTSLAIQDMKWASEVIYTGGLDQKTCRVDRLDSLSLTLLRSSIPGTDRCYTEEGMAIFGGRFFFLPEDQPNSRVYAFSLP